VELAQNAESLRAHFFKRHPEQQAFADWTAAPDTISPWNSEDDAEKRQPTAWLDQTGVDVVTTAMRRRRLPRGVHE
jgi:hypothetical protein